MMRLGLLMSCLACACGEFPLLGLPLHDTVWGSSALWDQLYLGDVYRNFDSLRSRNRSLATDDYRLNDTGRRYRAASLVCDVDDMRMDVSMLLQLCEGPIPPIPPPLIRRDFTPLLHAGSSTCDGPCKEAFHSRYTDCVRGYVPVRAPPAAAPRVSCAAMGARHWEARVCQVLVDGGFLNSALQWILTMCSPNDRSKPLPLHIDVMVLLPDFHLERTHTSDNTHSCMLSALIPLFVAAERPFVVAGPPVRPWACN
jgi:hypothetical protein